MALIHPLEHSAHGPDVYRLAVVAVAVVATPQAAYSHEAACPGFLSVALFHGLVHMK